MFGRVRYRHFEDGLEGVQTRECGRANSDIAELPAAGARRHLPRGDAGPIRSRAISADESMKSAVRSSASPSVVARSRP